MRRRVSLPGADELFRPTQEGAPSGLGADLGLDYGPDHSANHAADHAAGIAAIDGVDNAARQGSGRVRHDAKMTVYVTDDELYRLEHARLTLRREQGIAVDRGRLVREAVSIVLTELDNRGSDAEIVARLTVGSARS